MAWSITGYSNGSRTPITYNLRSGQFRGPLRGFNQTTIINNNIMSNGYRGSSCCNSFANYDCGCNDSMPKWMQWATGIGVGGSVLSNILGMFSGGGKEKAAESATSKDDLASLKTLYKGDGITFSIIDGEYMAKMPDKTMLSAKTPKDLISKIGEHNAKAEEPEKTEGDPTVTTTTTTQPTEGEEVDLPDLFKDMTGFKDLSSVLTAFKGATGTDATALSDLTSGITIDSVIDKGNKTEVADPITISSENMAKLKNLKSGETISLGKMKGKDVVAENLDGYIRIKVGTKQTYIVGTDANGKYKGYQFEGGNIEGLSLANWTRR